MTTTLQLPGLYPFSATSDQTMLGHRWSKWVKSLEYFLTASNTTNKHQKLTVLLLTVNALSESVLGRKLKPGFQQIGKYTGK